MGLIITNEARCRDCYRCLRSCPIKAIRITTGQDSGNICARVIDELCVHDASCVLACPQKAKRIVSDLDEVKAGLKNGVPMVAGVAPSFVAGLPLDDPGQMPALLRKLGFKQVQEISFGAELVADWHCRTGFERPYISSACPVVVNLIERHYPELIPLLAPVVSPMIAHGRYLKNTNPEYRLVFIGPCAAKKAEAKAQGLAGAVDYVLGFDELWTWIQDEGLAASDLAPEQFDGPRPGRARLFPIEGGLYKTMNHGRLKEEDFISITGLQNCIEFLQHLSRNKGSGPKLMELLACRGGCINGPMMSSREDDIYTRRLKVAGYQQDRQALGDTDAEVVTMPAQFLARDFSNLKLILPTPDEAAIKEILAQTGKYEPGDELNCGACGYDTCRDKAVAVFQGHAEVQMCIPYMRKRAESMSNLVMAAMPNAIIIVDHELVIKEANPAAQQMFSPMGRDLVGRPLHEFMEPDNFRQVLKTGQMMSCLNSYPEIDVITREIIFPLEKENAIVAILVDVTAEKKQREQFELVKGQTIARAQAVITKQMKVAQEIAGLLGETTAETKVLLNKLIELMQEESH